MQLRGLKPNMIVLHVITQTLYRITRVNIGCDNISKLGWVLIMRKFGRCLATPYIGGVFTNLWSCSWPNYQKDKHEPNRYIGRLGRLT